MVIYLLNNANLHTPDGWFTAYTATELWTVPAVAGAFLAWRWKRDRTAVALALMAVLFRETTAGLLLGGLVAAYLDGRQMRLWVAAIGLAALAIWAHAECVSPHLVPAGEGSEPRLLGTGGPVSVLRIAGLGLPGGDVVGPLLWGSTLALVLRRSHWAQPGLVFLMLPLVGLLIDRPAWGVLVVPFTLVLGWDAVARQLAHAGIWPPSGSRDLGTSPS